jgi:serine/threonine protein kinase
VLKTLHHPHIVPYLDHFWDDADQALYLVMAFCDCGDLLGLIERTQAKSDSSHKRAVRGASPPSHHPAVAAAVVLGPASVCRAADGALSKTKELLRKRDGWMPRENRHRRCGSRLSRAAMVVPDGGTSAPSNPHHQHCHERCAADGFLEEA